MGYHESHQCLSEPFLIQPRAQTKNGIFNVLMCLIFLGFTRTLQGQVVIQGRFNVV